MRIGICDDEFYQRNMLDKIIEKLAKELHIKIETKQHMSGEELLKKLEKDIYSYDILLLDIQMKELTGIDVARILRETNQSTLIIFITAVPDFVFEGYNVRAFNYILKPIDERKVKEVLTQAIKTLEIVDKPYYTIVTKEATHKIDLDKIIYFKSDKRLVEALTTKGEYCFYSKLDEIEEALKEKGLIRCHQRYLVNREYMEVISENEMILKTGEKIPISRNRYKETMLAFAKGMLR